ncbi:MAG: hypothetical protein KAI83_10115 [Thiomargarita sp.]|nr:hypothetical protein [Thiomargarita sp.]
MRILYFGVQRFSFVFWSHVGWATWLPTTLLMRKVGKKRTLPTLHHL